MSIVTPCPNCGCSCKVSDTAVGKQVKCPRCATPFRIPATTSTPRSRIPWLLYGIGAFIALVLAGVGGGVFVWFLFLRSPASSTPSAPAVAVVNEAAKPKPNEPSAEEIQAKKEEQAARRRSVKNLKQLALAFQNHAGTYAGRLPPAMTIRWQHPQPKNQPLRAQGSLSWRVLILPFLAENQLYNQFKLDEPWDSPNNKKLLAKMPKIYAPVRGKTSEPGMTYYQVFVGEKTPFLPAERLMPPPPGDPMAWILQAGPFFPASIPDGTSTTFLVVEAGEPVPWTKPDDLPYDAKKPLPKLGGLFPDGFHAAAFSGEVYFIPRDFKETDLRRMIVPNDFEAIESELKPLSDKDGDEKADGDEQAAVEFGNIRGKVTYLGKPLAEGGVRFVGKKTFSANITAKGDYELRDVPTGTYTIAITVNFARVRLPAKYFDPDTSGLSFELKKGGDIDFDILLQ